MALSKEIMKSNGITLSYHRVAMVKIDTNQQNTILIHSYLNEGARNYEKAYARGEIVGEPSFPYVVAEYLNTEYDGGMTISNAYDWLKQQPEYEGAVDVL